ncbi:undecaprenyldiphospho-muramoylpentapeptide beta-N-acetylglucosaminyltransferase [Candidatus Oleimmundimicrobium sp.]|uniref:undecaprenyldiphospho-muramoylpentapeptide beta-N-acetylglucosaminyltransferase n=1 Tax=Candidatus Oleimmundimicrobium sp. TaxID=3060597 RepID=UPI0027203FB2|nr:undecaprenyldiphospho-muramoylpentapeptide beta-N-acetylglucosaminyltransferase [Candidatus Oleimmundimicrobium sp.]MDO8885509.1 undecaprenyldiphospho-muramoylpentapeptide beta-N-acetylglucosaminyltransferase [Candidatus Oleimmundimicrobium sp.]
MRVIITGGGTAGHIYPGLAIADEIKNHISEANILFVGTKKGLEATVVPKAGYDFKTINIYGLKRKISLHIFVTLLSFFASSLKSLKILRDFRPQVVVGTGGYVSAPLIGMAILLRIPTIIHEQNSVPGLVNKVMGKWVDVVTASFPDTKSFFKGNCIVTGNPVRKEILKTGRKEALSYFPIDSKRKTLLVFGGSQGSKRINESLIEAYDKFRYCGNLQIIHVTGRIAFDGISDKIEKQKRREDKVLYNCYSYLDSIGKAYAASDLVLSRAGATTIAEITAIGIPSILVPYPYATGNHQEKNALILEHKGASRMILDKELNGIAVFNLVNELIFNDESLGKMRKNAAMIGKPKAAFEIVKLVKMLGER